MSLGAEIGPQLEALLGVTGRRAVFRHVVRSTGPNPTEQIVDYPVKAAIQDYNLSSIDGTMIQQGDRRATVLAYGPHGLRIQPAPADRFVIDGISFTVISVRLHNAGDKIVSYTLQLR